MNTGKAGLGLISGHRRDHSTRRRRWDAALSMRDSGEGSGEARAHPPSVAARPHENGDRQDRHGREDETPARVPDPEHHARRQDEENHEALTVFAHTIISVSLLPGTWTSKAWRSRVNRT